MRVLALFIGLIFASLGAQAQTCIAKGGQVSGTVVEIKAMHPNGTQIVAQGLVLATPRCAIADGGDGKPARLERASRIHLANARERLTPLIGRTATIRLHDLELPSTAWHLGDLISFEWELVGR